jgi:hypothetical protein
MLRTHSPCGVDGTPLHQYQHQHLPAMKVSARRSGACYPMQGGVGGGAASTRPKECCMTCLRCI